MSDAPSTRRLIGPFNRVEGDLEVQIEIEDGRVSRAWVNSPLYRGFEQIMVGKDPRDALVVTPRICGICSISQSVAAARALAQAQGIDYTPNGRLATNLILACENMADHLSHFYLFFMPDFARADYRGQDWYKPTHERFAAQTGNASREVLPARAAFLHITGLLAGKWPHSLALQPGGTTRALESRERIRLQAIIAGFRRFLEKTLFGDELEAVAALDSADRLNAWAQRHAESDFGRFLLLADRLHLDGLGHAAVGFMSYGAYPTGAAGSAHLFAPGVWLGNRARLRPEAITEDISHSWMHAQRMPKHPYDGSTLPDADAENGYSWCKAPRYNGQTMEVGALARQLIDGHPLIRELAGRSGGNVRNRVVARLLELARVVPVMEQWTRELSHAQPYCNHGTLPKDGQGMGLVEAARGSLGHWLRIKHGRILNYQIVAPTTWNFSPRDVKGTPGALEQTLVGTEVGGGGKDTVAIQHIVRSFDPCMVCTVH
jgi:Ni,Fe-hydrogenase I large subunit